MDFLVGFIILVGAGILFIGLLFCAINFGLLMFAFGFLLIIVGFCTVFGFELLNGFSASKGPPTWAVITGFVGFGLVFFGAIGADDGCI